MSIEKISLQEKFSLFNDHWSPKVVGRLNGQAVKLAKLSGEFIWHKHDNEDELFLVVKGNLQIQLRDGSIDLKAGEMAIIPRGVEHKPVAHAEVQVMLFEPLSTLNTGDQINELTKSKLDDL